MHRKPYLEPGAVAHICNPSNQKTGAVYHVFEATVDYMSSRLALAIDPVSKFSP